MSTAGTEPRPSRCPMRTQRRDRRRVPAAGAARHRRPDRAARIVRAITGADDLTSSGTIGAALALAVPIGAGRPRRPVGRARRRGQHRPRGHDDPRHLGRRLGRLPVGAVGRRRSSASPFGAVGGLLHAVATVTFGVDHIVSGVAINILGLGVAQYLVGDGLRRRARAAARPSRRRSATCQPCPCPGSATRCGDARGARAGSSSPTSPASCAGLHHRRLAAHPDRDRCCVVGSYFVLWRTAFGLRLRSCGENPVAAESLGVNVYLLQVHRGASPPARFAGLGGAFLAIVAASIYREGQTGGRGFIGLAAMIFGNWRPGGLAAGRGPVRLRRRPAAAQRRRVGARPAAARRRRCWSLAALLARASGGSWSRRPSCAVVGAAVLGVVLVDRRGAGRLHHDDAVRHHAAGARPGLPTTADAGRRRAGLPARARVADRVTEVDWARAARGGAPR